MKRKLVLLLIIYLAFISLGLPDSLLGPAWPDMYSDLGVPSYYAGILSMIVAIGTVISSLLSGRLVSRFGVAAITAFSVLLTALAMVGYSYSDNFLFLSLLSIPLGLGAGSVDAALNNYVAVHYKARHMNWLHCFWGIGAAIGPLLMSRYLASGESWSKGYNTVGWLQLGLFLILILSIPLWVKNRNSSKNETEKQFSYRELLSTPGLKQMLIVFFSYCALEASFGLWGASYLVFVRDFSPGKAAGLISFYYIGITLGRFLSGIISMKWSNKRMVYSGQVIIALGLLVILLPYDQLLLPGFFLVGLGCAPIFPSLLHETPRNFGEHYSQHIMGIQMASAYVGISLVPLLFGKLASYIGYSSFTWFIGAILIVQVIFNYRANRIIQAK